MEIILFGHYFVVCPFHQPVSLLWEELCLHQRTAQWPLVGTGNTLSNQYILVGTCSSSTICPPSQCLNFLDKTPDKYYFFVGGVPGFVAAEAFL